MGLKTDINISMTAVWKQNGLLVRKRVQLLQRAADALLFGRLDQELEARATVEAHTLRGEFGTFGFSEAATVAASAEALLKAQWRRAQCDANELQQLVQLLRLELEASVAAA